MATAQLPAGTHSLLAGTTQKRPQARVYAKPTWEGQWMPAPYLWPIQATLAAAPRKGVAQFEYLVGRVKAADSNLFNFRPDIPLRDTFVRIVHLPDNTSAGLAAASDLWVGRVCEDDIDLQGVTASDGVGGTGPVPRGRKLVTALGLEHELDRSPIGDSFTTDDGTTGFFVEAPLVFNEHFEGPSGLQQLGNRSRHYVPNPAAPWRSAYAFAGAKDQTDPWRVSDIVTYLLNFHTPDWMGLSLAGNVGALDDLVLPRVNLFGRTVFQALDHLIDRRRGLGWCLRMAPDGNSAVIHVYSVFDQPVQFEDATIQANGEQVSLDLGSLGLMVDEQSLQLDTLGRFGSIIVAGEQVLSCFTLNMAHDETLEIGWTQAEEATYRAGYTADDTNQDKNRAARAVDELAHVYRHYHVPKAFKWMTGNGGGETGDKGKNNANPLVGLDGKITPGDSPQSPIRNWGHRFERHLPLKKKQLKPDSEPEYLEPFVLVQGDAGWEYAHNANAKKGGSAHIRMLDTAFGIEVRFTPAHVLGKGMFDNAHPQTGAAAKPDSVLPRYDPTTMLVTVACRLDARLSVVVDIDPDGPLRDRVLFIEVPDAELHYVVPGTVIGVNPLGVVQYWSESGIVRDDGDRLRRIAAMAKAWYGKERRAMTLTVNDVWQQYPVGSLVLSARDRSAPEGRAVNTPVTQITYDLREMKTTLRTCWAELDVTVGRSAGRKRT